VLLIAAETAGGYTFAQHPRLKPGVVYLGEGRITKHWKTSTSEIGLFIVKVVFDSALLWQNAFGLGRMNIA
jgi:hypothetical protein